MSSFDERLAEHEKLRAIHPVRLYTEWNGNRAFPDIEFKTSEGELLGLDIFPKVSIEPPQKTDQPIQPSFAGTIAPCMIGDAVKHVFDALNTPPVKVFIETTIVGPALTALVKSVVEKLCRPLQEKVKQSEIKHAKVVLYGPDGREIDWKG